jgi:hypothetical protein
MNDIFASITGGISFNRKKQGNAINIFQEKSD